MSWYRLPMEKMDHSLYGPPGVVYWELTVRQEPNLKNTIMV